MDSKMSSIKYGEEIFSDDIKIIFNNIRNAENNIDKETLYESQYIDNIFTSLHNILSSKVSNTSVYNKTEFDIIFLDYMEKIQDLSVKFYNNKMVVEFIEILKYHISKLIYSDLIHTKVEMDTIFDKLLDSKLYASVDDVYDKNYFNNIYTTYDSNIDLLCDVDYTYDKQYIDKNFPNIDPSKYYMESDMYDKQFYSDKTEEVNHLKDNSLSIDEIYDRNHIDQQMQDAPDETLYVNNGYTYTREQMNSFFSSITDELSHKINASDVYSNTQIDQKVEQLEAIEPPDYTTLYNIDEFDDLLLDKMDKTVYIVNSLESEDSTKILSANNGQLLDNKYDQCELQLESRKVLLSNTLTELGVDTEPDFAKIVDNIYKYGGRTGTDFSETDVYSGTSGFIATDESLNIYISNGTVISKYNRLLEKVSDTDFGIPIACFNVFTYNNTNYIAIGRNRTAVTEPILVILDYNTKASISSVVNSNTDNIKCIIIDDMNTTKYLRLFSNNACYYKNISSDLAGTTITAVSGYTNMKNSFSSYVLKNPEKSTVFNYCVYCLNDTNLIVQTSISGATLVPLPVLSSETIHSFCRLDSIPYACTSQNIYVLNSWLLEVESAILTLSDGSTFIKMISSENYIFACTSSKVYIIDKSLKIKESSVISDIQDIVLYGDSDCIIRTSSKIVLLKGGE